MKYCPKCERSYSNTKSVCEDDGEHLILKDPYNLVGRTIADKYRIEVLVGMGGMGAVYSAYQIGIDRRVAFKVLLPHLAVGDERVVSLFEREARMAGQLFHENIATVFDAGRTADDIAYIAMEWLEGQTLEAALAAHGPFSLNHAADILRQIAAALDAAHAKHIIHRDLKPSNVMLIKREDGREQVKVLDFGLAKVISETTDSPVSAMMGTPHYASPEQFNLGAAIDGRTDIYSLGVMLYQMLTKKLPFNAPSIHELIKLQQTTSPTPIHQLRPEVSVAVGQLISRMMAKDPKDRPQRVGEVSRLFESAIKLWGEPQLELEDAATRNLIDEVKVSTGGNQEAEKAMQPAAQTGEIEPAHTTSSAKIILGEIKRHKRGMAITLAVGLLFLIGIGYGLYKLISGSKPTAPQQALKIIRLVNGDNIGVASISPDGKYIAYASSEAGKNSLWVKQVSSGSAVRIVEPSDVWYEGTTFSPDGESIYFTQWSESIPQRALYQMPVLGGMPKKVLTDIQGPVTFSPDGKRIAFHRWHNPTTSELILANADGSGERKLATRKGDSWFFPPSWSPDGKTLACGVVDEAADSTVCTVSVDDGREKPITSKKWNLVPQVSWLKDGSGLVILGEEQLGDMQIWHLSYPNGEVQKITNSLQGYKRWYSGLSVTSSAALVATQDDSTLRIWTVGLNEDASHAKQVTSGKFDGQKGVSWLPDGRIV